VPYADDRGIRIHYEVEGDGPPLLLHHGFTLSLEEWRQFGYVDVLKRDYQLILVDGRGHGASDKPHEPAAYAMELRASDVAAVLDALGVQQTHYVGYSMGGRIGLQVASRAPGRLMSLVVGGADPYATQNFEQRNREWFSDGLEEFLERQPLPDHVKTPAFRARMLANDVTAFIASGVDYPSLEASLPTLTMPCLVYYGDADPGHARGQAYARLLPNATFVSLPGLDHWAGLYRSDLVLPYVRAFLDRVTRRAASAP
jgi:pimeloyl-ACP methyl ester carboxylesterase